MIDVADLRPLELFRGLTSEQLRELVAGGTEVLVEPGDVLFTEGERADFWWVLVDGGVELVRHVGREDVVVAVMDAPGRWAGGFAAWDEHGTYLATGRCVRIGRMLRVPADVLRRLADAWFSFAAHLITGLYHTARSIESTARQRDSLITLGTLAAGIAHDINNPASASARDIVALEGAFAVLLSSLRRLASNDVTAQQFAALDTLRQELRASAGPVDPLARSDREQTLAAWLSRRGVQAVWTIAPPLANGGVDVAWCERAAAVLESSPLEPALEWVASTLTAASLLTDLAESTRRIVELVGAVRSYTQLDRASFQQVQVVEGIESTLSMLGHRLADGIEIVRDYAADLPPIEAYAGELNQVWTNLITNALDAMSGAGRLRVSAWSDADTDTVVVEVADTGEGMPPEVAARAFEPFYTTKDVGEGSGLGLDIARRIVEERHGGTIVIDRSRGAAAGDVGETVLRVRLPAGRDQRTA